MRSNRVACVLIDHLPLQVEQRLDPSLLGSPVIVSGVAWKPDVVLDASPQAIGVWPGMGLPQARQVCPLARVIAPREELYYAQHDTLLRVCEQFSPQIETAGLGQFFLDVSDMQALYPTEQQLAITLLNAITQHTNLWARVGIASSKFVAEQAARQVEDSSGSIVAPKRDREFLAPLPIDTLPRDTHPEILRRLGLFGIETLGQFAALSPAAVARQFGPQSRSVHDLARGIDPRPLDVTTPPPAVTHVAHFTRDPLRDRIPLMHSVARVARMVAETLDVAGFSAEGLRIVVTLEDDREVERATTIRPPTAQAERLAVTAQRVTSLMDISAPVTALRVTAYPLRPWHTATQQLGFVDNPQSKQAQLQLALESLWSRFGELVIRVASLVGSPLPLRIQVQIDAKGRPSLLKWGGWTRMVRGVLDHWRSSSRWWQQPVEREHYLVQTQSGSTYSVYAQDQHWYVDRKYPR
jgi:DNA polymerase-4